MSASSALVTLLLLAPVAACNSSRLAEETSLSGRSTSTSRPPSRWSPPWRTTRCSRDGGEADGDPL